MDSDAGFTDSDAGVCVTCGGVIDLESDWLVLGAMVLAGVEVVLAGVESV